MPVYLCSEKVRALSLGSAFLFIGLFSVILQAGENQGFLDHSAKECAPVAEIARQSTFRILLPTVERISMKQAFGQDTPEMRSKLIAALKARHLPAPNADDLNLWQIESCVRDKSAECSFSKTYTTATMVLTGDGQQALTAFHNIKALLNEYIAGWRKQGFSSLTIAQTINASYLPLFVYDFNGKLVASPANLSVQIQGVTAEQVDLSTRNLDSNDFHSAFDRVTLKFSRSLGKGARLAQHTPKPGETLRLFGYPMATADRQNIAAKDSNGSSFYCTLGTVLTPEAVAKRANWSINKLSAVEELLYRQETIFASNDAVGGNSGGPLFNEAGEIVALLSRGNNKPLSSVATGKLVLEKPRLASNP